MTRVAKLALEDGTIFTGVGFGFVGEAIGEAVFNTSMTGYQEVLTDPSYTGQIVTMTYPHIGNYGVNVEDCESAQPHVEGFVVRSLCRTPSNYRSGQSLDDYLIEHQIPGIEGIDTRSLVRRLRARGAMTSILSHLDLDNESLVRKARNARRIVGHDLTRQVMPDHEYGWDESLSTNVLTSEVLPKSQSSRHVVALDFGLKWNILRCLTQVGCRVTVLPGSASAQEILAHQPDGLFLSNGPGDPEPLHDAVQTIQTLCDQKPVFGICLGLQLLGLALGGKTYKLKFGHRGANQPVLNRLSGQVEITTQNHGFAVAAESLPADVEVTHINLNDGTLEGLRHQSKRVFGVQYHPESSAGPHDSTYLFEDFRRAMDE